MILFLLYVISMQIKIMLNVFIKSYGFSSLNDLYSNELMKMFKIFIIMQ